MANKHMTLTVRIDKQTRATFAAAVAREAELFGFEERSDSAMIRELMRDYVKRIESIGKSAEASAAAKTLKGRVHRG